MKPVAFAAFVLMLAACEPMPPYGPPPPPGPAYPPPASYPPPGSTPAAGYTGGLCGGIGGIACKNPGDFCRMPTGQCRTPDAAGVCAPRPEACYQLYQPVCGCNGQTYANACVAEAAGTSVAHAGACQ